MSVDGYIAGPGESGLRAPLCLRGQRRRGGADRAAGDDAADDAENAQFQRDLSTRTGAIVVGRHLYDMTQAWGGTHPMGCPVVVLTNEAPAEAPSDQFHFVTGGIAEAVATASRLAEGKEVRATGRRRPGSTGWTSCRAAVSNASSCRWVSPSVGDRRTARHRAQPARLPGRHAGAVPGPAQPDDRLAVRAAATARRGCHSNVVSGSAVPGGALAGGHSRSQHAVSKRPARSRLTESDGRRAGSGASRRRRCPTIARAWPAGSAGLPSDRGGPPHRGEEWTAGR
jgi:dihydrofolate reductase